MAVFQKIIDTAKETQKTLDATQKLIDSMVSMIDSIKKACDLPKKIRNTIAIVEGNVAAVRRLLRRMSSHPVMKALNIQMISLVRMLRVLRRSLSRLNLKCIALKVILGKIAAKLKSINSE
ncbi:unnamed protein product, partial [marine sediment metagenome]